MNEYILAEDGQFDEIYEKMIELRIACPERGYPQNEALYDSVEEWQAMAGRLSMWED